jgi:thermitase
MKSGKFISIALLVIVYFALLTSGQSDVFAQTPESSDSGKPVKLLVKFKENRPSATSMISLVANADNGEIIGGLPNTGLMVMEVKGDVKQTLDKVKANGKVSSAIVMPKVKVFKTTNDTYFNSQWNIPSVKANTAWDNIPDLANKTATVKVAVVDTGIERDHPDLAGKIDASDWVVCDSTDCVKNDTATDGSGHGTHVAGIIGGIPDNSQGVAGIGWGVKLIAVQVLDASNEGDLDVVLRGISWASEHGAKVINMSLGLIGDDLPGDIITAMQNVVDAAWNNGSVLVAAAGNCGRVDNTNNPECVTSTGRYISNSKSFPGASNHVISVAAIKGDNTMASYSNHNDATVGNWISVIAPGGEGTSSIWSSYKGKTYRQAAGTSMASPHVAAIAAMILSVNSSLSNSRVKEIIETTADKSVASGVSNNGLVNAQAAVAMALTSANTPTPTPTSGNSPTATPTSGSATLTPTPSGQTITPSPTGDTITPTTTVIILPTTTPIPTATPTVTPWPLISPRLPKTPPNPYPSPPYCAQ